ncbi:MAG: lysophospholipase [Deltaproteobacteria bacterium]|nr:lysophospholipase [Deltaproteobacteria bacterium]
MKFYFISFFVVLALIYLGFGIFLYFFQERIIFPGAFYPTKKYEKPVWLEEISVRSADNKILIAWQSAEFDPQKPTVFFFHGNNENISSRLGFYESLKNLGLNVVIPSVRGYYGPHYDPSVPTFYQDSETIFQHFSNRTSTIFLLGYSLGGAAAAYISYRSPVAKVVLYSTFSSLRDVARENIVYRLFLPLLRYDMPNVQYLGNSKANEILIVHGGRDRVVSSVHYQAFTEYFKNDSRFKFIFFPEADHANIVDVSWPTVKEFLGNYTETREHLGKKSLVGNRKP